MKTIEGLPDLHKQKESPIDLSSEYWTPGKEGEYKVGFVIAIEDSTYTDEKSGESVDLPCMIMIEQTEKGELLRIRNGSKRLVAAIENALDTGAIVAGKTPIKIIFRGKDKNKTNSYLSDRWSVKPLIIGQ